MRLSYSCVSDQFDSILLSSLLDWPLPIDLDSVEDPLLVEVVDGGGQVVEAVLVADERAERVGGKVAASERGDNLQGRVLGPDSFEVGLSFCKKRDFSVLPIFAGNTFVKNHSKLKF